MKKERHSLTLTVDLDQKGIHVHVVITVKPKQRTIMLYAAKIVSSSEKKLIILTVFHDFILEVFFSQKLISVTYLKQKRMKLCSRFFGYFYSQFSFQLSIVKEYNV